MAANRSAIFKNLGKVKRVVIKVGTSLLTDPESPDGVNRKMIMLLQEEILYLRRRKIDVVLISSGSVGMGRENLKNIIPFTPLLQPGLVRRQALAAIGQSLLIAAYGECFAAANIPVAQILITWRDLHDRNSYLNIGNTIEELIDLGVLPIVNENDTVSADELRYGDNDVLSAACTSIFRAEILIILTSVDGFIVEGKRISALDSIGPEVVSHAGGPLGPGSGGMKTKLRAAHLCLLGGEAMAILPGSSEHPVQRFFSGEDIGTLIAGPSGRKLSARKRWLLYALPQGTVRIDKGATRALSEHGSSLLPAGIIDIRGKFLYGDVIDIEDEFGRVFGRGLTNFTHQEMQRLTSGDNTDASTESSLRPAEAIHRNNMILEI